MRPSSGAGRASPLRRDAIALPCASPTIPARRSLEIASLVGVALLFTLLNAPKPLIIDDPAYFYYARHIAEHPTDPYGFEIFWGDLPTPAAQLPPS